MLTRNYNDEPYKIFRSKVRKRDGYKCKMPGCTCKKNLQVHHIRPWSKNIMLRYDISNGITLCKNCHKQITGKEHFYAQMFEDIINDQSK